MRRTRAAGVMALFMFSFSLLPYPLIAEGVDFYRDLFTGENRGEVHEVPDFVGLDEESGRDGFSSIGKTISPDKDSRIEFEGVVLEIPAGAVREETGIRIIKLPETVSLEEGMSNATTGARGYRFEPYGIHFEKNVKVSIPFEEKLLESEAAISNLFTYFYNEEMKVWERLPRLEVDRERKVVVRRNRDPVYL